MILSDNEKKMFGKVATSASSKALDRMVRDISIELKHDFNGISYQRKLTKNDFANHFGYVPSTKGCEPDGGIWFRDGLPVLVVEAKYQGERGNAEERWYKNAQWISHINSKCIYYTLASGTGCRKTFVDVEMMSYITYNKRNLLDCRWSLQENGFTYEEVKEIFMSSLNEIIGMNVKPFQYPRPLGVLNV